MAKKKATPQEDVPKPSKKGVGVLRQAPKPVQVHGVDGGSVPNWFPDSTIEMEHFGDRSDVEEPSWQPTSPRAIEKMEAEFPAARLFAARAVMYMYANMVPMHVGLLAYYSQRDALCFRAVQYEAFINEPEGLKEIVEAAKSLPEVAQRAGVVALRHIPQAMGDVPLAVFAIMLRTMLVDGVEAGAFESAATPIAHTSVAGKVDVNVLWLAREDLAIDAYEYILDHFSKARGEVAFRPANLDGESDFDDSFVTIFANKHQIHGDVAGFLLAGSAKRLASVGIPLYAKRDRNDPSKPWDGKPAAPGIQVELEEEIDTMVFRLRAEVVATNSWGVGLGGDA